MFKNILIGIDGSEHALKATKIAGELARCIGANLWLVACFEPVPTFLGESNLQAAIIAHMSDADRSLQSALQEIGEIPGELSTQLLEGSPADTILSVAEDRDVDLIVMGTRGLGRLIGLLLGSQSQKVVANAQCPVLLVR